MAKKILCSVISFILCAVIAFVSCYFAIPDFNAWVKDKFGGGESKLPDDMEKPNDSYEDNCDLDFFDGESNGIQLLSAKLPYEAYVVNGIDSTKVAYQLTAMVMPETAENKAVDWSAEWVDSSITDNVYDYITVTPTYDGSCVANVICEQAFTNDIVIVVKTRQGGFTAEKICVFVGKPTSINLTSSQVSINNGATALSVGLSYDFDISQSNVYNSVGEDYNGFSVSMGASGVVQVGDYHDQGVSANDRTEWTNLHNADFSTFADSLITYSLSGSVLSIKINRNVASYYASRVRDGVTRSSYTYYDKVNSIVSDCCFTFNIRNSALSNVQYQLTVKFDTTSVSGVSISGGEVLEF